MNISTYFCKYLYWETKSFCKTEFIVATRPFSGKVSENRH